MIYPGSTKWRLIYRGLRIMRMGDEKYIHLYRLDNIC